MRIRKLIESSNFELKMRKQNYEKAKADFENYGEEDNNDVLSREEKMLIAKAELDKMNRNIQVGDKVKVSTPGNDFYNGRIGTVDYIDDVVTVLFDDGKSPKLNNFDLNQITKVESIELVDNLDEGSIPRNAKKIKATHRYGDRTTMELSKDGTYWRTGNDDKAYPSGYLRKYYDIEVLETDPNYKPNRTKPEYVVQGNYGYGWEDLTASDNQAEARNDLKSYRENETGVPHRLITRRVPVNESVSSKVDYKSFIKEIVPSKNRLSSIQPVYGFDKSQYLETHIEPDDDVINDIILELENRGFKLVDSTNPDDNGNEGWVTYAGDYAGNRVLAIIVYGPGYATFKAGYVEDEDKDLFESKSLKEASYGGAYDIADDQYLTRDDLMSFAEEVLGHVSETFNGLYDIGGVWFEKGNLITTIVDESDGEFTNITKIDMRKIKEPWHLKRAYAMKVAADIIEQIKDLESDVITEEVESADNSITEASNNYYVTVYEKTYFSGPEEGGYTSEGWEATISKEFKDLESAEKYQQDFIEGAEVLSNSNGCITILDEANDEVLVCIENSRNRGSHNAPAKSWAEAEMGVEFDKPYFDASGKRLPENPKITRERERRKEAFRKEYLDKVNAATKKQDIIDLLVDKNYDNIEQELLQQAFDKYRTLNESIEDDFADITSLADDCGENTFKVSARDMRFRFKKEEDETKFINKLYELDIPYTQAAYGVVISKSAILDESLNESTNDLDNPNTDMPEPGLGTGLSNAIIALINDEWEAIEGYNSFIATLAAEGALPEAIDVIKDIANEENLHVGQLQKLLQMISPNADSIAEGEKEADRQVQEFNNEEINAEVTEEI